jgi:RHS repeat-associated protein
VWAVAENHGNKQSDKGSQSEENSQFRAPTISLPKGGGAIHGMGEKFAANPVTGTGSVSVPIATSPGRSGFGPQLSISYDSGAGNGSFGFGWNLSLPSITRKTNKGLPKYWDAEESDVFVLSGAEDLVPILQKDASGKDVIQDSDLDGYRVRHYRPRIEGLFARIERWTSNTKPSDVHWRSISKDNILTLYGSDEKSRIFDPEDNSRIFSWLICETRDDKGNGVLYRYKAEDGANVELGLTHERNRGKHDDIRRTANRYLKHIYYGNQKTLLDSAGNRPRFLKKELIDAQIANAEWMFQVVFDYGEHDENIPKPSDTGVWKFREDPFSSYRSRFEIRTTRICQRVLMFHHFSTDANTGRDCLVRSTDFHYSQQSEPPSERNLIYTFLQGATQTSYQRQGNKYAKRRMPPVEFEYSLPEVQDTVETVAPDSLENLPIGVDGGSYQWTDLHGEGIPGILTELAGAWFYKRNLSPISTEAVEFSPVERVTSKPNLSIAGAQAQFMDLAGNGRPDLVVLDGSMPGFYEHDEDESWDHFRPFISRLNRDMRDPNIKFIDLDGDGHADVLISEDDAFIWHASLAEEGFGPAMRVAQVLDEEKGPRLVFADGTQSIYLADMSGDGLTDLVRVRNGEVCYWPNVGYGRFGAKVGMHSADYFDNPDQFDHKRIRLADIDGSGTTDLIYLHRDGVRLYFNQSGNGWAKPHILRVSPRVSDTVSIVTADLQGNGTACLVWSSPLPSDSGQQMRFVNLMGNQKPHLLISSKNNLGTKTEVKYVPSTFFYLQDKRAGTPWVTKLPFPVHVVEKVTVTDRWRKTSFASTYSYHHGYFDGVEREFRGFGRVEQVDVESYGLFEKGNIASPYITNDKNLYQPPVKTVTWYHTGALQSRQKILSQYKNEYFPHWLTKQYPSLVINLAENALPEPDLAAENLSASEWREALRACKGMMLRQEVYELDVDALNLVDKPAKIPVKLFSTAYHNCHIRRLQPKASNRFAVFLVAESEAITYHYELDIRPEVFKPLMTLKLDPRINHTLNLAYDEYGNPLQSVAIVYPRVGKFQENAELANGLIGTVPLINQVQQEMHLAYAETRYTADFGSAPADKTAARDNHRLRVPCEALSYELTGIKPKTVPYFSLAELQAHQLSAVHQTSGLFVSEIAYHQIANTNIPQKRLIEHAHTLFFAENLVDALPFKQHGRLGLPFETYKLALTDALLAAVFKDTAGINKLDQVLTAGITARTELGKPAKSGYLRVDDQYWIRSGIAGFQPDAAQHFYLPERYTDPFGNITTLSYDLLDLFVRSSADALGNTTQVKQFDFRVLAPKEMQDANENLSEVFFDILGLPAAMAVKGKGTEADSLLGFTDALANPATNQLTPFFTTAPYNATQARDWLGNATARHVYYFGETEVSGETVWGTHPACACGIVREQHVNQLAPSPQSPIQASFEYSDGMGSVVVKKVQAEPEKAGQPMRWVGNGRTILNNKGKPVKQYEPSFSPPEVGHLYDEPPKLGVTSVIYYDSLGRVVRTEMPDSTYSRVEFSPWHVLTFDQNDTVIDSKWYTDKNPLNPDQPLPLNPAGEFTGTPNQRAAWLAAQHRNTPALTILDSLGRDVISVAHNRVKDTGGVLQDEKYVTFTKLDAEGKPLWIRDARKNLVMQYVRQPPSNPPKPISNTVEPTDYSPTYDISGNLLFQHSMDAGDRWLLNDAAGKPMLGWNSRGFVTQVSYDALHRPTGSFVTATGDSTLIGTPRNPASPIEPALQFEKISYGEDQPNNIKRNLRGKPYQHCDGAGQTTVDGYDFKGNPLSSTRQLVKDYKTAPNWLLSPLLDTEIFTSNSRFDALNRPIQLIAPHSNQAGTQFNIIQPSYNEANLLERVDVWLKQSVQPTGVLDPTTASLKAVSNIDYDAKGQRLKIEYNEAGHPIVTTYEYDTETFRLIRLQTKRDKHLETDKRTLQDLHYTYDPVGNITDIRDDAQQRVYFDNAMVDPSNAYAYDALYRLIHAEGREHAAQNNVQRDGKKFESIIGIPDTNNPAALQRYKEDYLYDPVGNFLSFSHNGGGTERWVRLYQYAVDSNRLLATRSPGEASNLPSYVATAGYASKYTYDTHGNMTTLPHLSVMEWDFKDQLHASQQQVVNGGTGEKTYYVYDSGGERVRKITELQNGQLKDERIYLGGFEIYRKYSGVANTRALERETLHVMDDKQRIALVETRTFDTTNELTPPQTIRYQLGNHLGSATLEIDEHAHVITYEEYHPYGTTAYSMGRSAAEVSLKRYRYTGKERDEETGFSYHSARYYLPWLGRWGSCDPIGVIIETNLYVYGINNPIIFYDPDGEKPKSGDVLKQLIPTGNGGYKIAESKYQPPSQKQVPKKDSSKKDDPSVINKDGVDYDLRFYYAVPGSDGKPVPKSDSALSDDDLIAKAEIDAKTDMENRRNELLAVPDKAENIKVKGLFALVIALAITVAVEAGAGSAIVSFFTKVKNLLAPFVPIATCAKQNGTLDKAIDKIEQLAPEIESQAPVIESEIQQATSTVTAQLQKADGTTMLSEAVRLIKDLPANQRVNAFSDYVKQIMSNATDEWRSSGAITFKDGTTAFMGVKNTMLFDVNGAFQKIETPELAELLKVHGGIIY